MRIWDLDPGFLNNQSLLGEHRELHGMVSIFINDKKGYRNHPETKRWENRLSALIIRHELLVEEMELRSFNHKSPVGEIKSNVVWPKWFIDPPGNQYKILQMKYSGKPQGRIILTNNTQELWAKHKYSTMARDYNLYKKIGSEVTKNRISFAELADNTSQILKQDPPETGLKNTIDHMWGYVSKYSQYNPTQLTLSGRLKEIQKLSINKNIDYLLQSTALGELGYWCRKQSIVKTDQIRVG